MDRTVALNQAIDRQLLSMADKNYKQFSDKLITTQYDMLGIRIPNLRKLAKQLSADPKIWAFLNRTDFPSHEHVMLYGFTLANLKKIDMEVLFTYLDRVIPRLDNWAQVDAITSSLKIIKRYPDETLQHFLPLKQDEGEFTKRFFVILLLCHYMDERHIHSTLRHLSEIPQGQYYVDMAISWAISVGLVKFFSETLPYLQKKKFSPWVHNKAIQKARESYRIAPEIKSLLNEMKV